MTYYFSGVVAPGGGAACGRALADRFGGVWREIADPFPGFVLAFAADYDRLDTPAAFELALIAESARFPGQAFIALDVECFGGVCVQWGVAFRDGAVLARIDNDEGKPPSALRQLAEACGAPMPHDAFPAFERNFFANAGDKSAGRDRTLMRAALALAAPGIGRTGENPVVGCIIATDDGIEGEARTADGGRPHAEEQALAAAGRRARGATAYVTLEPCAQRSAGGVACSDLLIQAGIARVVIAARDPHPNAAGAGLERLRQAGVRIDMGVLEADAREQNAGFFSRWDQS